MDNRVDQIISKLENLKNKRNSWEQVWQYIAERFDPKDAYMTSEYTGQFNPAPQSYDSTAMLAINKWASAIDSLTTPKNQKWHKLTITTNPIDLTIQKRFSRYLEELEEILFSIRYSSSSNFATANFDALKMVGFYGNGPFSINIDKDKNLNYKSWSVKDFYVDQNFNGDIDTFYRTYTINARQFKQEFGEENTPKDVLIDTCLDSKYKIIHAVFENNNEDKSKISSKFKKWSSLYISISHKKIIEEGGFDTCPYIYQRYDVMPSIADPYGYSPLMYCLPDIRSLNIMVRDNLRVSNRVSNPALLMSDDDVINASQITPGMLIPEGLDANSQPRVRALDLPGNIPFALEFIKEFREKINQAFNLDLLQTVINKRYMTATEVLQRSQEISMLLTPITSRREREFLAQVIKRELDLLHKLGKLPNMPDELSELIRNKKAKINITYESPLRRAQKSSEGQGILNLLQAGAGVIAFDPRAKNSFNGERILNRLANTWGTPLDIFNTQEEKNVLDEADAKAAQVQSMLNAAQVVNEASNKLK